MAEAAEMIFLSFRDAPLGASPESITTIGSMDSGLAPSGAPRNDEKKLVGSMDCFVASALRNVG